MDLLETRMITMRTCAVAPGEGVCTENDDTQLFSLVTASCGDIRVYIAGVRDHSPMGNSVTKLRNAPTPIKDRQLQAALDYLAKGTR
jgi:hypothetical protein